MRHLALTTWVLAAALLSALPAQAQSTYYVDRSHPNNSDTNPGTEGLPFSTIQGAIDAHSGAGVTILVKPGTYREQITIPASGAPGDSFVVRALGDVVIEGADNYFLEDLWQAVSPGVFLAASAPKAPRHVILDGVRLAATTVPPASMPAGTFRYVDGEGLYVRGDGTNPGSHDVFVGQRRFGFRIDGRSWVVIDGFTLRHQDVRGVSLTGGAADVAIINNVAEWAGTNGIAAIDAVDLLLAGNTVSNAANHGFYLERVDNAVIEQNVAFENSRPTVANANGMHLLNSDGNVVRRNRLRDNQGSGLHFENCQNNVCQNNLLYDNGAHGAAHVATTGTVHVGETVVGNTDNGFSYEAGSTGNQVYNSIAVNNGVSTVHYDVFVDVSSIGGFASDYNLIWNATPGAPIEFGAAAYTTIGDFNLATGHDGHSVQANPLHTDPAAGDFSIPPGSPAVDAASSAVPEYPATDFFGQARYDEPGTPNTGAGAVPFTDIGALEYRIPMSPNLATNFSFESNLDGWNGSVGTIERVAGGQHGDWSAKLTGPATTAGFGLNDSPNLIGAVPAAGSRYLFSAWVRSDNSTGDVRIRVREYLGGALQDQANTTPLALTTAWQPMQLIYTPLAVGSSLDFQVLDSPNAPSESFQVDNIEIREIGADVEPMVTVVSDTTVAELQTLNLSVVASDLDGNAITALTADLTGLPIGHGAVFTPAPDNLSGILAWTPTSDDSGSYVVRFTATNAKSGTDSTVIHVTNVDRAPLVVAPATAAAAEGQLLTLDVTAADADGDAITTLSADLSNLPVGHDAVFTPGAGNTTGTLTWTPAVGTGAGPFAVSFIAANTLNGADTTIVTIDQAPQVAAADTSFIYESELATLQVTASDADGDSITALTADLSNLPAGHDAVFTATADHTGGTLSWTPTFDDAGEYWVTYTASNVLSGSDSALIVVQSSDRAPVVAGPAAASGNENTLISFDVSVSDPENDVIDSLTVDLSVLPAGHDAVFTPLQVFRPEAAGQPVVGTLSGTLTWTPTFADSGTYELVFVGHNARAGSLSVAVTVHHVDRVPEVVAPSTITAIEDSTLTVSVTASDPDGDPISLLEADLSALPPLHDAVFVSAADNLSGLLTWTPTYADGGTYPIAFTAANFETTTTSSEIAVDDIDRTPQVTAPLQVQVNENELVIVQVTAEDFDGDPITSLTADLSVLPAGHGAVFTPNHDNTSGTLLWTPTYDDGPKNYRIVFTASSPASEEAATIIQVANVDRAPTTSVSPESTTVAEGDPVAINVTASDVDGDSISTLTADLSHLPAGHNAVFTPAADNLSGVLTWTPTFADSGRYIVPVTAANALSGTDTAFIHVTHVDLAPVVLAPSDTTAAEGELFTMVVGVTEPDGDAVTSLTADLSALPIGNDAAFTPALDNLSGTLTWTLDPGKGPGPFNITFTATNALVGQQVTSIVVSQQPIIDATPDTVIVAEGVEATIDVDSFDPDADPITSLTADLSALPLGHNAVFALDAGDSTGTLTWTPTFADSGQYRVYFTAANDLSATDSALIIVTNVDLAPVVSAPSDTAAAEGVPFSMTITAADLDGDAITSLTADLSELPAGNNAVFTPAGDNLSGTLTWTPTPGHGAGPFDVRFTAANALFGADTTTMTVDQLPVVVALPETTTVSEGAVATVNVTSTDPDFDPITSLTMNLSNLPAGNDAAFTLDPGDSTGTLTWTTTFADSGRYWVYATAANALSSVDSSLIIVTNVDRAPIVSTPRDTTAAESGLLSLAMTAFDPDGDAITSLTADLNDLPVGNDAAFVAAGDNLSGTLTWTPTPGNGPGPFDVRFLATNALGGTDTTSITVNQKPVVTAPTTAGGPENTEITVNVTATDADGEPITLLTADLSGLPLDHNAVFTPGLGNTTGVLTWTPSYDDAPGPYIVGFTAANSLSGSSATVITPVHVDRAPVVTAPDTTVVAELNQLTVNITIDDADGDPITGLTADLTGLPAGHDAVFTPGAGNSTAVLTWMPQAGDGAAGPYPVIVYGNNALADTATIVIHVDRRPIVTAPGLVQVAEGETLSVAITASDPDGDAITSLLANLSALPAGHNAVFTPALDNMSGTLTWVPDFDDSQPTPYFVTFTASNMQTGGGFTQILVTDFDQAPVVVAPSTVTVSEDSTVTFSVTASDGDGDAISSLTADLSGLPAGHDAEFTAAGDNLSGTFTWTPQPADAGGTFNVDFMANNAKGDTATTAITIDRRPVVTAPATETAAENQLLTVNVTAADPDGDAITSLTADLSNLPLGHDAVFSTAGDNLSGTLTWTPTFDDAGGPLTVTFTATNSLMGESSTAITIDNTDRAPITVSPVTANVNETELLTVNVTASDPDGDAMTSLTADLSGLPTPNDAVFTPAVDNLSGTLTWTPTFADMGGPYTVTFISTNALADTSSTDVTVGDTDRAPIVTADSSATGTEDIQIVLNVAAVDPDGDAITSLTADLSNLPAGHNAQFVPAPDKLSGTFTWTPAFGDAPGPHLVTFIATNALSGDATTSITLLDVDRSPVVTSPTAVLGIEATPLAVHITAADPDGDPITSLTADLSQLPPGNPASFVADSTNTSGTLNWTPNFTQAGGPFTVTFTATNALSGQSVTELSIQNFDRPPSITAPSVDFADEGQVYSLTFSVSDADGEAINSLTANLNGLPAGHNAVFTSSLDNTSGTLTWTPTYDDAPGIYTVSFTAFNALSSTINTGISVNDANQAPVASLIAIPTAQQAPISVAFDASGSVDADGSIVSYTYEFGDGASFGPTASDTTSHTYGAGDWIASLIVVDDLGARDTAKVLIRSLSNLVGNPSFEVDTLGWGPSGSATLQRIAGGQHGSFECKVMAPEGSGKYGINDSPNWVGTSAAAGALYRFEAWVRSDSSVAGAELRIREYVGGVQQNLVQTPAVPLSTTWQKLTLDYMPVVTGSTLDFNVRAARFPGLTNDMFRIDNISAHLISVAGPATVAPDTVFVTEGDLLVVNVTASDADGLIESLTADLSNLPAGNDAMFLAFGDNENGTLTWTPTFADAPGPYAVSFTAANEDTMTASTVIVVENFDRAPVATAPVTAGGPEETLVTFGMSAFDPDGEAITSLTADLSALPAGHDAVFTPAGDNLSGVLTWTPTAIDGGVAYPVTFVATNALAGSTSTIVSISNVDQPPVITAPAAVTVIDGDTLTVDVSVNDVDGDAINSLVADLSKLPVGNNGVFTVSPDKTMGTLTWIPQPGDLAGPYTMVFTATNALAGVANTVITVDHFPTVDAPTSASGGEGTLISVAVTAADPDANPITSLTADLSDLPAGHNAVFTAAGDNLSGTLDWTPTFSDGPGSYVVRFTAENALSAIDSTTITVDDVDAPPVVSVADTTFGTEGELVTVNLTASDLDGDAITSLTADLSQLPVGHDAVFTAAGDNLSGTLTWTPTFFDGPGPHVVSFTASNALSGTDSTQILLEGVDQAPIVTLPATAAAAEGETLSVAVTVSDPDGDAIGSLLADLSGLPTGHNGVFTPAPDNLSGTLVWVPTFADATGPYTIRIIATNALADTASSSISVSNTDRAPVVTAPAIVSTEESSEVSVEVTAFDPDGAGIISLTADLSVLPAGHNAVFDVAPNKESGTLTWTPAAGDSTGSPYDVVFTASNAASGETTTSIVVGTADLAPIVAAPNNQTAVEDQLLSFDITASDPNGEPITSLTADLSNLPGGHDAVFTAAGDNLSGTLTWTPTFDDAVGPYPAIFTASNALGGADTTWITVNDIDRAPIVDAPTTSVGPEGSVLTVNVSASDPDGNPILGLTADLSNLPVPNDAVFTSAPDNLTGTLTWTPLPSDIGGPYNVRFTASNKLEASDSTDITITVADLPPVVVAPDTISTLEFSQVTINVTASDGDADPITSLTADLSNLPVGHDAVFTAAPDNLSGTLTWTPTIDDAPGPYDIRFTASNALSGSDTTAVTVVDVPAVPPGAPLNLTANLTVPILSALDLPMDEGTGETTADESGNGNHATLGTTGGADVNDPAWVAGQVGNALQFDGTNDALEVSHDASLVPTGSFTIEAWVRRLAGGGNTIINKGSSGQRTYRVRITASGSIEFRWETGSVQNEIETGPGGLPDDQWHHVACVFDSAASLNRIFVDGVEVLTGAASGVPFANTEVLTIGARYSGGSLSDAFSGLIDEFRLSLEAVYTANFTPPAALAGPAVENAATIQFASATSSGFSGGVSTDAVAAPSAPVVLVGEVVELDWDPAAGGGSFAGYNVYRSVTGGPMTKINTSLVTDTEFTDETPVDGQLCYEVRGESDVAPGFEGTPSNTACVQLVGEGMNAPTVTAPATDTVLENGLLTINVTADDLDGDPITSLTADLSNLPFGHDAVFTPAGDNKSGTLTWTPGFFDAPGPYDVTFTASNTHLGQATTSITVTNVDRAPVVTAPATDSGDEGTLITVNVTASDVDGEAITSLTADLSNLPVPNDAVFTPAGDNASGTLTWTPTFTDAPGPHTVTFIASNALSDSASTAITVGQINQAPVVTGPDSVLAAEGALLTIDVNVTDIDGDAITSLTADLTSLPAGHDGVFTPAPDKTSGSLTWTPATGDSGGVFSITFVALNAEADTHTTVITVGGPDLAPVVTAPATDAVVEGSLITVNVTADDADGDAISSLTADLSNLPAGHDAVFTPAGDNKSGTLTWTPTFSDGTDDYDVTFTASNALNGNATTTITVTDLAPGAPQNLAVSLVEPITSALDLPMDEGTGETTADQSGNGNHATLGTTGGADASDPAWVAGQVGNALQFDGANDVLEVAHDASLVPTGSFTIEAWVRRLAGGGNTVVNKGQSGERTYRLRITSTGSIEFRWETGSVRNEIETGPGGLPDDQWHHLACVFDSAASLNRIFVDGTEVLTGAASGVPFANTDVLTIGARYSGTTLTDAFSGLIDEFRIAAEALYTSNFTPFAANVPVTEDLAHVTRIDVDEELQQIGAAKGGVVAGASLDVAPSGSTTFVTSTIARLTWDAAAGGGPISGYNVYRSVDGGSLVKLNSVPVNSTTYDDSSLVAGNLCYEVRAEGTDPVAEGPASNQDCVTYPAPGAQGAVASNEDEPEAGEIQDEPNTHGQPFGAHFSAQMVPNPAPVGRGVLHLTTTHSGFAKVEVYDASGRRIKRLLDVTELRAGTHQLQIDGLTDSGRRMPAGTYFYRVRTSEAAKTGRFVLLR